jgi:dephospho-CoA kinase
LLALFRAGNRQKGGQNTWLEALARAFCRQRAKPGKCKEIPPGKMLIYRLSSGIWTCYTIIKLRDFMAKIIALTGEKLSGKDAAADYLEKKYGAFHARHSHILDEILRMLDLPVSRRNEIDLAMGLRRAFGTGIVGRGLRKRVLEMEDKFPFVLMNGVRFKEEADDVRSLGGKMIYITAPEDVRYKRYLARKEKADDAIQSLEEFRQQEKEPTEAGISELGRQADFKIENAGSLEDLHEQADKIITAIK